MAIEKQPFGMFDGRRVDLFTVTTGRMTLKLVPYGARVTELHVPDKGGKLGNVVLGFDNLARYVQPEPFFGASIGRVANRIAKGQFTLDGKTYQLPTNNGPNTLHGGPQGFDKKVWEVHPSDGTALRFTLHSPDGDMGFPGAMDAEVTYTVTGETEYRIDYAARCDAATIVNLTNHTYFNLSGPSSGDILGHRLTIAADHYTPVDSTLIPTGEVAPVKGTPFDFTTSRAVGERIATTGNGYDHNFCLNARGGAMSMAARVEDPKSGRAMEISTTQPGIQFYSGNFLDGSITGIGGKYGKHGALCLETQHWPDAINHANFPGIVLRPGEVYRQSAVYRFSTV